MKIDVHNHAIPEPALDLLRSDPVYRARFEGGRITAGDHISYPLERSFSDPLAKLAELERAGLEAAVVSPGPPILYYELELEPLEAMCRATNSGLAEYCAAAPDRLRWMADVPLPFPERAAATLEEAAAAGAVGVEVGTRIPDGRRIDQDEFEPFWAAAARLGLPVLPHPAFNEPHRGLADFYLQNVIGNMLETTVTIERLICAGVLDRHPDLRLVLVHSGGYYPYQGGRLRHARTVRPELASAPDDPFAYGGRVLVDTITHDVDALRYLVGKMGVENVVMGTDLPFDMATPHAMDALEAAVDAKTARRIAQDNPARLYGFDS